MPVPTDALALSFLANQDNIQNGDHDGVAIIDTVTNTLVDALAYEGAIDNVTIPGFPAPVSLVEGTVLDPTIYDLNDVTRTLCRDPNGKDTNNANADWKVCNLRTVGALNKVM